VLDQLVDYFKTRLAGYPTTLSEDESMVLFLSLEVYYNVMLDLSTFSLTIYYNVMLDYSHYLHCSFLLSCHWCYHH